MGNPIIIFTPKSIHNRSRTDTLKKKQILSLPRLPIPPYEFKRNTKLTPYEI